MWIISVAVWVVLATATLYAPREKQWPVDTLTSTCKAATWFTSAVTRDMCEHSAYLAREIKKRDENKSPRTRRKIEQKTHEITQMPGWRQIVEMTKKGHSIDLIRGLSDKSVSPDAMNEMTSHLSKLLAALTVQFSECVDENNALCSDDSAKKTVIPHCLMCQANIIQLLQKRLNEQSKG